jgi:hypothetical protein
MKPIRETKDAVVVRTDFSDSTAWDTICAAAVKPQGDFRAYVHLLRCCSSEHPVGLSRAGPGPAVLILRVHATSDQNDG